MNTKQQKQLIEALAQLSEQKGISKSEVKNFLEEVFVKAFNKEDNWDWKNPIDEANIVCEVNIESGEISIKKFSKVVETLNPITKLKEIEITDPRVIESKLSLGDEFVEVIDLSKLPNTKLQHLKQLLIQKTREAEKVKLYEAFVGNKGTLITAKIIRVEDTHAILDKDGTAIFLPKTEMNPNDKLIVGKPLQVYVVEVDNLSKDAQVVASRANIHFIEKIFEQNNDDVKNGTVILKTISREPGVKTKIIVESNNSEIDPIASIIGPKGQKIKTIIDELNGERIDVIKYSDDLVQLIGDALSPSLIKGVILKEEIEGKKEAIIIVDEENFLPALGKRGVNVKLVAKLIGMKVDIKKEVDAKNEGLEWVAYTKPVRHFSNNNANFQRNDNGQSNSWGQKSLKFDDLKTSVSEILDGTTEIDYNFNVESNPQVVNNDSNFNEPEDAEILETSEEFDFNEENEEDY